jgi:hypothetical protein
MQAAQSLRNPRYDQAMPDELLSVLTRFHREVVVRDIERIVDAKLDAKITPLREEMLANFDAVFKGSDHLSKWSSSRSQPRFADWKRA